MQRRELPFIQEMFDGIAPRYDFLNRLLSLRRDVWWRRATIAALDLPWGAKVLDVACGTGDVALELYRQKGLTAQVVGVDFSMGMLRCAQKKMRSVPDSAICLLNGDALQLPFDGPRFHAVTIAFGIRNIEDKSGALKAFYEVLLPGGKLGVLELATPQSRPFSTLYRVYFGQILPAIGRLFSNHRFAYSYLPASVSRFPSVGEFTALLDRAGFGRITCRRLTGGIANLFVGVKPA